MCVKDDRFKEHEAITNRRLLWYGASVAMAVAILKSGIRIMPHSSGRLGKGIHLAPQSSMACFDGKYRNLLVCN